MLNFKDLLASIVRTVVPVAMGAVLTYLATKNITLDETFQANLRYLLEILITGAYYAIVRAFEHYVSPKFGWLLGLAKAPNYVTTAAEKLIQPEEFTPASTSSLGK